MFQFRTSPEVPIAFSASPRRLALSTWSWGWAACPLDLGMVTSLLSWYLFVVSDLARPFGSSRSALVDGGVPCASSPWDTRDRATRSRFGNCLSLSVNCVQCTETKEIIGHVNHCSCLLFALCSLIPRKCAGAWSSGTRDWIYGRTGLWDAVPFLRSPA